MQKHVGECRVAFHAAVEDAGFSVDIVENCREEEQATISKKIGATDSVG